jgi:hypothetical protein
MKKAYEINLAGEWHPCKSGAETSAGFLHYELADGSVGLTNDWRELKQVQRKRVRRAWKPELLN